MSIPTPMPPHKVKRAAGMSVIDRSTDTMRLGGPDGEFVWLQGGYIYDDAGVIIRDKPKWFDEEFKKLSPEMQKIHALQKVDKDTPVTVEASVAENNPKPASVADLEGLNKTELAAAAGKEGVSVSPSDTKEMILNKIKGSREERHPTNPPDDDGDGEPDTDQDQ